MSGVNAGWRTILDLNFQNQTAQTLSSDGAYTIGGYTANKTNTASETAAMAITSNGLVIQPNGSSTDIHGATFSNPTLAFPLNQFAVITPGTKFRTWMWVPTDNMIANYDQVDIGIGAGFTNATVDFNVTSKIESTGSANQHRWRLSSSRAGLAYADNTVQPSRSYTDNVYVTVIESIHFMQYYGFSGTYVGGWPAFSSLNTLHSYIAGAGYNDWSASSSSPTNWSVFVASGRVTSSTSLSVTVGRIRVDIINDP